MSLQPPTVDSFFANIAPSNRVLSTHLEPTDSFAKAIRERFDPTSLSPAHPSSIPPALSSSSLLSPPTSMASISSHSPRATSGPSNTSNTPPFHFTARLPSDLDSFINDPGCLILDIRPHAAFSSARLPRALSLSVPSTLLRRPLFSLTKLSKMLPSKSARLRFSAWSSASSILVYDAESNCMSDGSNIKGLLKKFRSEGFSPDKQLAWLKGGFVSVRRERSDLVVSGPEHLDDDDEEGDQDMPGRLCLSSPSVGTESAPFVLRTNNLPLSAFTSSSTTSQRPTTKISHYFPVRPTLTYPSAPPSSRTNPLRFTNLIHAVSAQADSSALQQPSITQPLAMPFNPFYDTVRQNMELSQGITERIPLTLPKNVRSRINDLPFPWLRHIARRAAPAAKDYSPSSFEPPSSHWSSDDPFATDLLSDTDIHSNEDLVEEGSEAFAMQFYRIELGEQRRLMGIMKHHSRESGHIMDPPPIHQSEKDGDRSRVTKPRSSVPTTSPSPLFPYSITAGIEKGAKNRYRNIWPFEHARVRLHKHTLSDDDYINASFVQPLGSTKRYIATQGPLDTTLNDFWTLAWEQNVHVIVMLTKELEGMHVKCSNYWESAQYGPLVLTLLESSESKEQELQRLGQEKWSLGPSTTTSDSATTTAPFPPSTIKRRLQLRHTGYPHADVRTITQLQYLEWPDLNVPDDPRGILGLVREVGREVEHVHAAASTNPPSSCESLDEIDPTTGIMKRTIDNPPVLLHCSAGVGRTGGFIAVDAILDSVRREIRTSYDRLKKQAAGPSSTSLPTKNNDGTMHEERTTPHNDGQAMEVDEDEKKASVQGASVGTSVSLPTNTYRNRDLGTHFPCGERSYNDGFSEDVSEKDSIDSDLSSQTDFVPPTARQKYQESVQRSSRTSPNMQFREWLDYDITPGSLHMTRQCSSSGSSSCGDGALGSRSGSVSGSAPESGESSQQNLLNGIHLRSRSPSMSRTSSSQCSVFPPSSSSSTRSSSEVPEVAFNTDNWEIRARTSSVPTRSSLAEPNPLRFASIVRSVSFGKQLHKKPSKNDNLHTFSSPGLSSPLSSSAQESTRHSSYDSAPLADSTSISSVSLSDLPKAIPESNMPSWCNSFQSASILQEDLSSQQLSSARSDDILPKIPSTAVANNHAPGFDYAEPRDLHVNGSPLPLSSFDEPVRRIVEDMREQRMSLCQSLRQYVFVHRAIIEGALMIVDEERARYNQEKIPVRAGVDSIQAQMSVEFTDPTRNPASTPLSKGKRIASLTELLKVNTSGEAVLSKRHSAKRKQRSDEDLKDGVTSSFSTLHSQFSHWPQRSPTLAFSRPLA